MATQTIPAYELSYASRRNSQQVADRNLQLLAAQQRARRGPTPEVFFTRRLDNTRLVKAADPVRVREMRTFSVAMTVLFVIVMFYGLQHLSAIEYGYRVEAQKQQRIQLEEQNRELRLTEAQLSNPHRIDQMARKLGLDAPHPGQVVQGNSEFDPATPVMAKAAPMTLGR
ncbi:MAG: cell division protein FtsL [Acidobacteriaceae bacterium]